MEVQAKNFFEDFLYKKLLSDLTFEQEKLYFEIQTIFANYSLQSSEACKDDQEVTEDSSNSEDVSENNLFQYLKNLTAGEQAKYFSILFNKVMIYLEKRTYLVKHYEFLKFPIQPCIVGNIAYKLTQSNDTTELKEICQNKAQFVDRVFETLDLIKDQISCNQLIRSVTNCDAYTNILH